MSERQFSDITIIRQENRQGLAREKRKKTIPSLNRKEGLKRLKESQKASYCQRKADSIELLLIVR